MSTGATQNAFDEKWKLKKKFPKLVDTCQWVQYPFSFMVFSAGETYDSELIGSYSDKKPPCIWFSGRFDGLYRLDVSVRAEITSTDLRLKHEDRVRKQQVARFDMELGPVRDPEGIEQPLSNERWKIVKGGSKQKIKKSPFEIVSEIQPAIKLTVMSYGPLKVTLN